MLENNENSEAINKENSTESSVNEVKISKNTDDDTVKAIEEIENSVAQDAEEDVDKEEKIAVVNEAIDVLDYTKLNLEELVDELQKLLKNNPVQRIKNEAEVIKTAFNQKFGALLAEKKAAFLAEGGNSIDFQYSSPIKVTYNKLLSEYKQNRNAYYSDLEKRLNENLEKRVGVIEKLKALIDDAEPNTMYKKFKELQDQWRAIGGVPKTRYNDTWKIYHHHVERFYDLLHLSNDFRDLDFKHNLEEKLHIIKKAEALSEVDDVNIAFKELQGLHKLWKEDVGPVAREMREEIWHKFSEATKKIHDKRHDYFRSMRSKYQEIIDAKILVIEKIEAYDVSKNTSHKDWQQSIKDIEILRKEYFDAGKLPYSKSEQIWTKFKEATKNFNKAKNKFYKEEKGEQQENLNKKMELVELAESLQESEEWEGTTNAMKKIQADWKKIGHVPRKFSDDIWKRFKAACNHYFERFHENKNAVSKEDQEIVDAKKAFLEMLKGVESSTIDVIKETIKTWKELGELPRKFHYLEGKFNKKIDGILSGLPIDKEEIVMLRFRNVIDGYIASKNYKKIESEQFFIRKKVDETVREMQQLENNLSFISNATEDNPLVKNVRAKVIVYKESLDIWQSKLNYLRKLEY